MPSTFSFNSKWIGCLASCLAFATVVIANLFIIHVNEVTAALVFMVFSLLAGTRWGFAVGSATSLVAAGCLDFFFQQPLYTFGVARGEDAISLVAFLSASYIGGHLSNQLRQKAATLEGLVQERTAALHATINELKAANEQVAARSQDSALISSMASMLQSCMSIQEGGQIVARTMQRAFPQSSGGVFVVSASRNVVEALVVWGDCPPKQNVFGPDECWGLRRGIPYSVVAKQMDIPCSHVSHDTSRSFTCVPLSAQGETMGILHLSLAEEQKQFDYLKSFTVSAAEQTAMAFASLKLREALKQQSIRDPLTGLFNRRHMEESLEREVRRCSRTPRQFSLFMLDIDHFKRFNDTFGHEAGDLVVRELGYQLQKQTRGEDLVCRYGGEEFVLILVEADLHAARKKAEQLIDDARHLTVLQRGRSLGSITISIGIAAFPEHGSTGSDLLRAADLALYRAKKEGRDRLVIASPANALTEDIQEHAARENELGVHSRTS